MRQALLRAFAYRNYRIFFAGQSISLVGTWMQQVAMSWLVYRLTGSAFLLGLVGFASQIPTVVLSPIAGVLADRCNRRRLLLGTQAFSMVQATLLAAIVLTGAVQVWHIVALSALLGIINSFDIPVRQSFVVELVEKRDLGNAIALNSSMVNSARLIGPSVAGLMVAAFGEGVCFVLNSLSYLAVLIAIAAMRLQPVQRRTPKHVLHELREGFTYAFGFPPIRHILTLVGLISLLGMSYSVLLPIFAREILHGDAKTFGFLMAAAGLGSLSGTLYLASRRNVLGLERIIVVASVLFSFGIIGFSLSRIMALSLAILCVAGFGAIVLIASCNTFIQTIVDDDKRGRVMSLFVISFMGMTPLGSLLAGTMAGRIGAEAALLVGGALCLLAVSLFARSLPELRRIVHPIYVRMGILSEPAEEGRTAPDPKQQ